MVNYLLKNFEKPIFILILTLSGLMLAIFPQISVGTIFVLGFIFFKLELKEFNLIISYLVFALISFFTAVKNDSVGLILQSIFPGFLYFGFKFINGKHNLKAIVLYILSGLILILAYSFITFWKPTNHPWNIDPNLASSSMIDGILTVKPLAKTDSWILKPMNLYESGRISYTVQIQASKSIRLNTFILQADNLQKRYDKYCDIQTTWTTCTITASFENTKGLYFGVGLLGTWKNSDPSLELRNADVISLERDSFLQRILDVSRVAGLTFNENAFGVTAALIGILALGLLGWSWTGTITSVFALLAMIMSGSRGAGIGFIVGLGILALGKSRFYKFIPIAIILVVIFIGVLQFNLLQKSIVFPVANSPSNLRLIDTSDSSSIQTRLVIWRLALKAWLETPNTILFGTGNLQTAMQSQIDTRATQAGFTNETITHAHSLWLQTLGESGLIGFFALLSFLSVIIAKAWREQDALSMALLSSILVINSVDYLFFFAGVQFFFWMSVSGFKNLDKETEKTL